MYSASVSEHLENSTSFLISYKFLQKKKYLIVIHRARRLYTSCWMHLLAGSFCLVLQYYVVQEED